MSARGGGRIATVQDSRWFAAMLVDALMDGRISRHPEFVLGFAAAVDAQVCGTVDWSDPYGTVEQAMGDVFDVRPRERTVTRIMDDPDGPLPYCYGFGAEATD